MKPHHLSSFPGVCLAAFLGVVLLCCSCGSPQGPDLTTPESRFVYYQEKFEEQRTEKGTTFSNPKQALTFIQECIRLNELSNDSLAEPGRLYYDMALAYRQLGDEGNEYEALCSALKKGMSELGGRLQAMCTKKRDELFALFGELDEIFWNDSIPFDSLLTKQKLDRCHYIQEHFDVGLWRDVYARTALYFMNIDEEHMWFSYSLMAANKGDEMATFCVDSFFKIDLLLQGEKTIVAPSVEESMEEYVTIDRVCLNSWGTIIECTFHNDGSGWMQIAPETYIQAKDEQYPLRVAVGIALAPEFTFFDWADEEDRFLLMFQAIPPDTKEIDLIESGESTWQFKGIRLE